MCFIYMHGINLLLISTKVLAQPFVDLDATQLSPPSTLPKGIDQGFGCDCRLKCMIRNKELISNKNARNLLQELKSRKKN